MPGSPDSLDAMGREWVMTTSSASDPDAGRLPDAAAPAARADRSSARASVVEPASIRMLPVRPGG